MAAIDDLQALLKPLLALLMELPMARRVMPIRVVSPWAPSSSPCSLRSRLELRRSLPWTNAAAGMLDRSLL